MARTPRHPVVAVMGHIDHGKSSLLDYIRKSHVTEGEAGGITQHVSAYVAEHEHEGVKRNITFLDTPGHEAFRALRARGAGAADVAILVVAADEGVKPQTVEAWKEIVSANVPFVVAFTKTDKNGADVERAKVSVLEAGIYLEGIGGSVPFASVSSKTGEGISELLDLVLLTTDLAELSADRDAFPSGFILESSQDPKRGVSATLIIKDGTLKTGMVVVTGNAFAPVRFIEDFQGKRAASLGPSEPAVVSGFNVLPKAGQLFTAVATKKEAERLLVSHDGKPDAAPTAADTEGKAVLPLVIKADVTGSVEAITGLVEKISHERVALRVLDAGVGSVVEGDVKTAAAAGGIIIAFHTSIEASARDLAERMQVPIETFTIIYELEKRVQDIVAERAPKARVEEVLGEMKIVKSFSTSGTKHVLGARYVSGKLSVGDQVRVIRRTLDLDKGKILNLQVARADVPDIHVEGEFGLQVESKTDIAPGDSLIAFRIVET
ncbi:GTP-binding protein [Candidatus Parcubacteria bacterium]|nr:GTP-binding protein [Candidatus Parcubacteria bacterium]